MPGKLYLIPNAISEKAFETLPNYLAAVVDSIRIFFIEEPKAARRLLKALNPNFPLQECTFFPLNEHTSKEEAKKFFRTAVNKDIGIISESGCPGVADPGANIVLLAHQHNLEIIPLVGPSSILLALMASGLNGQNFSFNGYLSKEKELRVKRIKELERRSQTEQQTQIIMETPYRNQHILHDLLENCSLQTLLCIAYDLTGPAQSIKTQTVSAWKKTIPTLPKEPALFLFLRPNAH